MTQGLRLTNKLYTEESMNIGNCDAGAQELR